MKLKFLKSLLSQTPTLFLEDLEDVTVKKGSASKFWVLDRAFVHHQFVPFPEDLAPEKRRAFVHMKVSSFKPYEETGSLYHWTEKGVVVWLWDQMRLHHVFEEHNLKSGQVKVVPITVFLAPFQNGLRMLKTDSGYEAQMWRNGALEASRYWPEEPSKELWSYFCRAIGVPVDTTVKAVQTKKLLEKPWTKTRQINWRSVETYVSKEGALAVLFIFMLFFGYEFGALSNLYFETQDIEDKTFELSEKTKSLENSRAIAQNNIKLIQKLMSFENVPAPLFILEEIAQKTLDAKARIIEFSLRGDKLSFVLTSAGKFDVSAYIKAYGASKMFENVNADPGVLSGANILKVTLTLKKSFKGSKK